MSIYSIDQDIKDLMFFTIDDKDVYKKMRDFNIDGFGKALEFKWVAPKSEFIESDSGSKTLPDVTQWSGKDLVLNSKAKEYLGGILANSGEYLPLDGKAKDYIFFNPTQHLGNEIVNLEQTKSTYFDDGSWNQIEKLVFNRNAESTIPPVFTIGMNSGSTLFCNQDFKDAVENNGLKGLIFTVVEQA